MEIPGEISKIDELRDCIRCDRLLVASSGECNPVTLLSTIKVSLKTKNVSVMEDLEDYAPCYGIINGRTYILILLSNVIRLGKRDKHIFCDHTTDTHCVFINVSRSRTKLDTKWTLVKDYLSI